MQVEGENLLYISLNLREGEEDVVMVKAVIPVTTLLITSLSNMLESLVMYT